MLALTYFVHGTTKDNENGIATGWLGGELSEQGIRQSVDLKKQIGDKKFDVVFCSDLKRAVDSAQLAFGGTVPIIARPELRECNYGDLNGAPSRVVEPLQEMRITEPFPNGESYRDVERRVAAFIQSVKREYDGKQVAIVAHKGPQLALDVLLRGKTWKQAFAEDWRKTKAWRPGWGYEVG